MRTRHDEWLAIRLPRAIYEKYGYLLAVVCIAVSTALFLPGRGYFAKGQWALLYLLIIGFVASLGGTRPAILAAIVAFFTWNYFFLPPFHTFYVHDPKDWVSLFAFLMVGAAMGVQTGRMREREAEALAREREMSLLNSFSSHLVSDVSVQDMADALLTELSRVTGASNALLFLTDDSGKLYAIHPSKITQPKPDSTVTSLAEWVHREAKAVGLPPTSSLRKHSESWPIAVSHEYTGISPRRGDVFLPLLSTTGQEGVLYVGEKSAKAAYSALDARLLVAVANQAAAFLERKRLQSVAVQADALKEADRLKSTLVSSVSHELKTPIAALTATVSNLLEGDVELEPDTIRGELESLQGNLNRLNASIGSLVDLSRLESAAWEPKKEFHEFGDILGTVLSTLSARERARVSFDVPDGLPMIDVDFQQWARVLQNLLENALLYSGTDSPVRVSARAGNNEIRMSVEDEGPGIPTEERERIFEKFYRGASSANVPSGTGLGLAVTREIVRFHGGRIWVEDVRPHGARFIISLPIEETGE